MAANPKEPKGIYHVPATVEDMKPPKASSLITEAANLVRAYYDEVKPYLQSISGEIPSMHGSVTLDEAAYVFKVKEIAQRNGFAFLGSLPAAKIRRALRFGFKRNTGTSMQVLEKQYRRLQVTHQQP